MKKLVFIGCLALTTIGGVAAAQACDDDDRGYRHGRGHGYSACCGGYDRVAHRGYAYAPRYERAAYYDDDSYDDYRANVVVRDRRFHNRRHQRADRHLRRREVGQFDRSSRFEARGNGEQRDRGNMNRDRGLRTGSATNMRGSEPIGPNPQGMNKGPEGRK